MEAAIGDFTLFKWWLSDCHIVLPATWAPPPNPCAQPLIYMQSAGRMDSNRVVFLFCFVFLFFWSTQLEPDALTGLKKGWALGAEPTIFAIVFLSLLPANQEDWPGILRIPNRVSGHTGQSCLRTHLLFNPKENGENSPALHSPCLLC